MGAVPDRPTGAAAAPPPKARAHLAPLPASWPARAAVLAALGVLYFAAAKLGLSLAFVNASASPVWPPTGLALAALVVLGAWAWPGVFVGAFAANLTTQGTVATSLAIAAGNTLEALVGALLVRRFAAGAGAFDRAGHVVRFVALAAGAATAVSATVGVGTLALAGLAPWDGLGSVWFTWWLGDAAGALVVAPPLVLWATRPLRRIPWADVARNGAVVAANLGLAALIFAAPDVLGGQHPPVSFALLPGIMWAAFRCGTRGAATLALLIDAVAVWGTLQGNGPFAGGPSPNDAFLALQGFTMVLATTGLVLGAAVTEQRRDARALRGARDELELRVADRTSSLSQAVASLRVEAAHRERAESRFRGLFEAAPDALVIVGQDGRIQLANAQAEALFGHTREALVGQPVELLVPARFRDAHPGHRQSYFANPRARPMGGGLNLAAVRADGSEFPVEISLSPLRTEDGVVVTAAIRDVTARVRAEQEVRRSEARLRSSQAIAHVGSWEWEVAEDRVTWSEELYALFGLDPRQFAATYEGFLDRVHADDRARVRAAVQRAGATGESFAFDHRIVRPGGEVRWFHGQGVVHRDAAGHTVRMAGTAQDVTERKRLEAEAAQAAQRAAEVEHLKKLHEFRTRFMSSAAHELNTPLTPIKIQLHLLRAQLAGADPATQRSLQIVHRNLDRLGHLVGDLLDSARLQAGRLTLHPAPADLQRLVEESVESFDAAARAAELRLEAHVAPDLAAVVDAKRVAQVLFNLIHNALKFTPRGGRVTVEAAPMGADALVAVHDSGIGLTPEQMARLFQPFTQVHDGEAHPVGGTGLGLYVSRGIVEAHGGRLWCDSGGPGKGTSFLFTVPLVPAVGPGGAPAAATRRTRAAS